MNTPKYKILVVDDSDINRFLLTELLKDEYEVYEADGGKSAIAFFDRKEEVSLVLLDIVMPDVDGYDVLKAMLQRGLLEEIPVIMISAENAASAIGERQVFPVQTNTIFLIFCFAIFRFTLPRQNPPRLFFHFFNAARPPKRRLCADDSERPPLPRLFASVPRQSVRPPFFPPV